MHKVYLCRDNETVLNLWTLALRGVFAQSTLHSFLIRITSPRMRRISPVISKRMHIVHLAENGIKLLRFWSDWDAMRHLLLCAPLYGDERFMTDIW